MKRSKAYNKLLETERKLARIRRLWDRLRAYVKFQIPALKKENRFAPLHQSHTIDKDIQADEGEPEDGGNEEQQKELTFC